MEGIVDYSRQAEFDSSLIHLQRKQINYIVGCGGVGFWLGIILAMQGQEQFVLIDGQKIERSNLNRLPVPPTWLGVNKAVALRKIIRMLRPLSVVRTVSTHIQEDTFGVITAGGRRVTAGGRTLYKTVWDCTDDARIQKKIFKAMKAVSSEIHYRKIGYEGFQVGSYKAYDVWIPEDYAPGYRTSNACAATSAMAAVIGLMSEGLGIEKDTEINVKELLGLAVRPTGVVAALEEAALTASSIGRVMRAR